MSFSVRVYIYIYTKSFIVKVLLGLSGTNMSNLRPRLCVLEKGESGYGFHLHTERGKSGQFIRLVEPDTPASASGLLAGDRLMFVNGENVEDEGHQQVVSRIRATAGALKLIVADADAAALLNKYNLRCQEEFVTEGIPLAARESASDAESDGSPGKASPLRRANGDASSESSGKSSVRSSTKVQQADVYSAGSLLFPGGANEIVSTFLNRRSLQTSAYAAVPSKIW